MIVFPDPNVETEYTDPNGVDWIFDGTGWVKQCDCPDGDGGGNPDVEPPDEHWAETYLLINCDDMADGSQDFVDATGNQALTVVNSSGWPKATTTHVKYGTSAMELQRTGNSRIEVPMFDVRQHWTVEAWVNLGATSTSSSGKHSLFGIYHITGMCFALWADGGKWSCILSWDNANINATLNAPAGSADFTNDEYQHIALSWDGKAYRLFVDGVLEAVEGQTKNLTVTSGLKLGIGATQNSGAGGWQHYLDGYLDDIRITEGFCRYTQAFTPPKKLSTEPALRTALIVEGEESDFMHSANDADLSELTTNVTIEE